MPKTIVLASRNSKKLAEIQALLTPLGWQARLVSEFTDHVAEETAPSFVENALLKARHAARISGLPAIADDSGLEVDALNGAPGVHSARYAAKIGEGNSSDAENNYKLLEALADVPDHARNARFVSVIVHLRHADDPTPIIAQGFWQGRIVREPQGANGFGYDPLFFIPEQGCTSAELPAMLKNSISHRAQAAAQLLANVRG